MKKKSPDKMDRRILLAAADLIATNGLAKGYYARTVRGRKIDVDNPNAAMFCPIGAIERAQLNECGRDDPAGMIRLGAAIMRVAGIDDIVAWADRASTSKKTVVRVMRAAADQL
jgi:hypothetical protein